MGQMQGHAPDRRSGQGFTLIELGIVLVIMGLVGTLFYNFVFQWIGKEKTNEAARVVAAADKLLLGKLLADRTGVLPAPESNPSPKDGEDGDLLPASLGLGNDPWGNRLRYFRTGVDIDTASPTTDTGIHVRIYKDAANFATDHPAAPGGAPASGPTGQANADQLVSNVAYVVLSLGPDGRKQYRQVDGSVYIDVLQPGLEAANAGGAGANERFDDQFSYKTLEELKNTYAAGKVASTATSTTTPAPPPAGYLASTPGDVEGGGVAVGGGGTVLTGQDVPDGSVLDMTAPGNTRAELTTTDAGTATYTEFTILGWFKTATATPDSNADVITIRQGTGGNSDRYTWWVGLWPTGATATDVWSGAVDDGSKTPGELVFMGSSASVKPDYIVDTNYAASPGHHDGKWHFFAVVMKDLGAGFYQATLYADTISGTTRTLVSSSTVSTAWNQGAAPANPAGVKTYIGGGQGSGAWNANFKGYLDDIYIYGSALSSSEITDYFNSIKSSYSTS